MTEKPVAETTQPEGPWAEYRRTPERKPKNVSQGDLPPPPEQARTGAWSSELLTFVAIYEAEQARRLCGCDENVQGGCPQPGRACIERAIAQIAPSPINASGKKP